MVVRGGGVATGVEEIGIRIRAVSSLQAVLLEGAEEDVPGVVVAVDGAVEEFEVVEGVVRVVVGSIPLGDEAAVHLVAKRAARVVHHSLHFILRW